MPILKKFLLPLLLVWLAACATLLPMQQVEIPLSRLQSELQKRFPFNNRYLDLFDVTLDQPQLALRPESDRLVATLNARFLPPLAKKPLEGKLVISGLLQIDPARRAVVLAEPKLESLGGALDDKTGGKLSRLGALLAEDLLSNLVLYRFSPDAFTVAGQNFNPTRITTRQDRLVISFEPAR